MTLDELNAANPNRDKNVKLQEFESWILVKIPVKWSSSFSEEAIIICLNSPLVKATLITAAN